MAFGCENGKTKNDIQLDRRHHFHAIMQIRHSFIHSCSFIGTEMNEPKLIWTMFPRLFLILNTSTEITVCTLARKNLKGKRNEEESFFSVFSLSIFFFFSHSSLLKMRLPRTFSHIPYIYIYIPIMCVCVCVWIMVCVCLSVYTRQCQIHLSEAAGYELFKRNTQINGLVLYANGITTSKGKKRELEMMITAAEVNVQSNHDVVDNSKNV